MQVPRRPTTAEELQKRIDSGELRESRGLEFKRELPPDNRKLAKQLAALAAEGGVLIIGVEETLSAFQVAPIDDRGARERIEQVARDIPDPPVRVESHIIEANSQGRGVLWIEIPPSPDLLHQVGGTYYERGDTQSRPMRDSDVADRMALRRDRQGRILLDLEEALQREQPPYPAPFGRTCVVAHPIGARERELYESTRERDAWQSFVTKVRGLPDFPNSPGDQYWGRIRTDPATGVQPWAYRDIEFQENGAFCHLSYSQSWLKAIGDAVYPSYAVRACIDAIAIINVIQNCTGQHRAWDLAFSIRGVEGRRVRGQEQDPFELTWQPEHFPIPRDTYCELELGVSTGRLERDGRGVVRELAERFVRECGREFDDEWPRDR